MATLPPAMRRFSALVTFALGIAVALAGATQYVASAYGYHSALGAPLLRIGSVPAYAPWSYPLWRSRYGASAPKLFAVGDLILLGVVCAAGLVSALLVLRSSSGRRISTTHGSARWATTRELRQSNLLNSAGVVLCQTDDAAFSYKQTNGRTETINSTRGTLIRHDGPEHVLSSAPSRSGKGAGQVLPSLLTWPASVIAWDIKRELWALTAGFRHQFTRCLRFEPTDRASTRYNPLLEIRKGDNEVRDTQVIADMLVDPDGTKEKDHWALTAHSLLVGAILHVLYAEPDKSLAGVIHFLSHPDRSQMDTLELMRQMPHLPTGPHPVVAGAAREMLNKAEEELSGVFSTALATLGLYRDPIVARATSASDFRIADIMNGDRPASLYLVVAPSDLSRLRPLMRLVINQIGRRLTESNASGGGDGYKHRLLFMLDEFPTLGKMDFFETALGYLAGYGIKCFLITQDLNQLDAKYGDKNSILANCHVRVVYGTNDEGTAQRISNLLGQATHQSEQVSHSGNRFGLVLNQQSTSVQETARALLTPGEILQLPPHDALLLVGGLAPYRAKKVLYYQDPKFIERSALPAPTPADLAATAPPPHSTDWDAGASPAA